MFSFYTEKIWKIPKKYFYTDASVSPLGWHANPKKSSEDDT